MRLSISVQLGGAGGGEFGVGVTRPPLLEQLLAGPACRESHLQRLSPQPLPLDSGSLMIITKQPEPIESFARGRCRTVRLAAVRSGCRARSMGNGSQRVWTQGQPTRLPFVR